ncbi:hypothetical protein BEP19_16545 [Ammoniphilus oxalaticus]|uniref:Nuclease SbcCD subunit C n=1 Tax=Ammoniphilus oxalaticus TaxID=66863 RepID=A0A419SQX5_9BACL|nr:AAA family ATPase [Ammoniphilus oxalaticus]RKD26805.1 hypothetical protein BEP19_16545 [Ammoniphilus oxalaticus]
MKGIQRVIIEDFQSHRYTEMELAAGFNVITGPSDQGKTAILRAIRWVLYNEPRGLDFIRVGATRAKVTLVMTDGTSVIRERSSSRNLYTVMIPGEEEQRFEGFGMRVPQEVIKATGVSPVKIDEDHRVALNIGMQLAPPFLLDSNGAFKAKAIGRLNGVHLLDHAHRTTSSELSSKQIEQRRLQADLEKVNEQLETYTELADWQRHLERAEENVSSLKQLEQRVVDLRQLEAQRLDLTDKLARAAHFLDGLSTMDQADQRWNEAQANEHKLTLLVTLGKRLNTIRGELRIATQVIAQTEPLATGESLHSAAQQKTEMLAVLLQGATRLREIAEGRARMEAICVQTEQLDQAGERLIELEQTTLRAEQVTNLFEKQREFKMLHRRIRTVAEQTNGLERAQVGLEQALAKRQSVDTLSAYAERWRQAKGQMVKVRAYLERSHSLPRSEQLAQTAQHRMELTALLRDYHRKWTELKDQQERLNQELKQIDQHLETTAETYYQHLKKIGRCPICLGSIETHTVTRIIAELNG